MSALFSGLKNAAVAIVLLIIGNLITDGWILRLIGGFAFNDITIQPSAFSANSDDLNDPKNVNWALINGTADGANQKTLCFFTRITVSGGVCALKQEATGWSLGTSPNGGQRCVVSCLKIDRRLSLADFVHH
jgi:hypothetical protein